MPERDRQPEGQEGSRLAWAARRIIEEYVADLREILQKLRRKVH